MNNSKKFNIIDTFKNTDGLWCLIWALFQQLVVALSTYLIIDGIRLATDEKYDQAMLYIGAFVLTLVVVYLPNTVSLIYLQRWRLTSFYLFVRSFIDINKGVTSLAHSRDKSEFESWLTNESFQVYEESTNSLYQVFSTFLNSALNIAVIAIAIDSRVFYWYLLAGFILLSSNKLYHNQITRASLKVQSSRKSLSNIMLLAWENIFMGNTYNRLIWEDRFEKQMERTRKAAVFYDLTRSLISSITVSLALIAIASGNAIFLFENRNNVSALAALIVTLPRQVQIVQNIFAFFNIYLNWKGIRGRLSELQKISQIGLNTKNVDQYIQFDKLSLKSERGTGSIRNTSDFLDYISGFSKGRFTLRGQNGCGKSTLLSYFSEATGAESFFLPSKIADLCFENGDMVLDSDGSRIMNAFKEILHLKDIKYILLDEWDANLDDTNSEKLNQEIDNLAQTKVVIESRHRGQIS